MQDEDYFGDAGDTETPAPSNTKETEGTPTVLLPKESLAGRKYEVGDKVTIRITADNEDSYEGICEHGDEESEEVEEEITESPMPEGDAEMSEMMG